MMMKARDVLQVLDALDVAGISVWLDGGWGVDALLGEETRSHDDLDAVVRLADSDRITDVLARLGFDLEVDARPTRLVLAATRDRRIDFHPVVFDADGSARQIGAGSRGGDEVYPADGFTGDGTIAGRQVRCLTPQLLVLHHLGYKPQAKDRHNVGVLCDRFGIARPAAYRCDRR
jgi:lincosamide nucleotidyltransferase A/C/D/E